MINEFGGRLSKDKELVAKRFEDMRDAHAIDPVEQVHSPLDGLTKKML